MRRDDLHAAKAVPMTAIEDVALRDGEVVVRVDGFAFTANNVTYATHGESMSYWDFFPARDGWGRVPVWGYGTVVRTACNGLAAGDRFFGYFPMSTYCVMQPAKIGPPGFVDAAPSRRELPSIYNRYTRTTTDPAYDAATEPQRMLLTALFITSFALEDFLAEERFFGAEQVVVSSASSKTAYGFAFLASERKRHGETKVRIVGLTSTRHEGFVKSLGCYDDVLTYDRIDHLPQRPATYVDIAGDRSVRRTVERRVGDLLRYRSFVGATHWEPGGATFKLSDARAATAGVFFTPTWIDKRTRDWGAGVFATRYADAWRSFLNFVMDPTARRLQIREERGASAVERVYREVLGGRSDASTGYVLSLA